MVRDLQCRGVRVTPRNCRVPVTVSWFKLKTNLGEFAWRYVASTVPASGVTIKWWGRW